MRANPVFKAVIGFVLVVGGYVAVLAVVAPVPPARGGGGIPEPPETSGPGAQAEGPEHPDIPWPFPDEGQTFMGVWTPSGPYDLTEADAFGRAAGKEPDLVAFAQSWATDRFDRSLFDRIAHRGQLPLVVWEPWVNQEGSEDDLARTEQPRFRLSRIIDGSFDPYIEEWARGVEQLGYPVAIRFAHEMNGDWYPWSEAVNGNQPGEYVAAWRHIHDIFEAVGAHNAIWVWGPNRVYVGVLPLGSLYPGDEYVDWVGISGYFGHGITPPTTYPTFDEVYGSTLRTVRGITDRPIVLAEIGATEVGGFKDEWIRQFFRALPRHPEIVGFVWFEVDGDADWRIVSSPEATAAFAEGVADPRYGAETPAGGASPPPVGPTSSPSTRAPPP